METTETETVKTENTEVVEVFEMNLVATYEVQADGTRKVVSTVRSRKI